MNASFLPIEKQPFQGTIVDMNIDGSRYGLDLDSAGKTPPPQLAFEFPK